MLRALLLVTLLALCFRPEAARAQAESPEAVAAAYYAAMSSADWTEVARLTHSRTQEQLQLAVLSAPSADPDRTERMGGSREQLFTALQVRDSAEAAQLHPRVLLERFLSRVIPDPVRSVVAGVERDTRSSILGHVAEGDSIAHAVRRAHFAGQQADLIRGGVPGRGLADRMDVLTLMKDGAEWRVLREGTFNLLSMADTFIGAL